MLIYKNQNSSHLSEKNLPEYLEIIVPKSTLSSRIDLYLIKRGIPLSRTRIQNLIGEKKVIVNEKPVKPGYKVHPHDRIQLFVPSAKPIFIQPEPIPLEILYQDADLLVLNKAPGLVMHPAPGNYTGTLVHALLHHCKDLQGIGGEERPGIVHRLDKETSGVVVVAKSDFVLTALMKQFKAHTTEKTYLAIVWGRVKPNQGKVDLPIGRDQKDRKKISSNTEKPREALTFYTVLKRFKLKSDKQTEASYLIVKPQTGRTHQIRVHLASIGHPIIGDKTYGGRRYERQSDIKAERQMLHASTLSFEHPRTRKMLSFTAPIPADMKTVLDQLEHG